jgi:transcriptional regulator with XRE-family HTH domain
MEAADSGVGHRVQLLRRRRGWSARRLAEECARIGTPSLTRGTLAKIESGVRKSVTTEELVALARALGVTPSNLLPPEVTADAPVDPRQEDAINTGERHGLIFVSIGAPSNRPTYERSPVRLGLRNAEVLGDYVADGYVVLKDLEKLVAEVRDQARNWAEDPRYSRLHLFYRGPVSIAPLLGRILSSTKPLVVYHRHEDGNYVAAYTLDQQFLLSRPAKLGGRPN